MKKILFTIAAGFLFGLSTLPAKAQKEVPPVPSWVSDRGYWVVESHADSSIVLFYNNDNQLMYKRRVSGVVDAGRRKTKLWLTKELEQVVSAREKGKSPDSAFSRQNASVYRQMTNGVSNTVNGQ